MTSRIRLVMVMRPPFPIILIATIFCGCDVIFGSGLAKAELPEFVGKQSRPHTIVSRPSQKVRAQLSRDAFFPRMAVQAYSMTAAVPPDHDGQKLISYDSSGKVDRIADPTDPNRILVQRFEQLNQPKPPTRFRFEITMVLELSQRRLVKGSKRDRRARIVDQHLSTSLRERYLRADDFFDYQSSTFQQWKERHGLNATSNQTEMEFARKVFDSIATDYRYSYDFKQNRAASAVCQSRATDCGGLSILLATVLRSEGIPARTLVGHFAKSLSKEMAGNEEPRGSRHVIAEFFADGVGWVPVDLASAILSPSTKSGQEHFGNQVKPFITIHFDHQIGFDSRVWGEKTENFFQFPRLWFRGKGPFRDRKISDHWNVRVLNELIPSEMGANTRDLSKLPPKHVAVPHLRQEKQLCACASASMILRTFGVNVPQARIKDLSNQMRQQDGTGDAAYEGTYFVDLVNGLKHAGIADWRRDHFPPTQQGFRDGVLAIYDNLAQGYPVMVDLQIPPAGHTVVVNGVDLQNQLVLIVDPNIAAPGIRRITFQQFESVWKSVTVDRRGMILASPPMTLHRNK